MEKGSINYWDYSYVKKSFLSSCEFDFFNKLLPLEEKLHVKIVPQIVFYNTFFSNSESDIQNFVIKSLKKENNLNNDSPTLSK